MQSIVAESQESIKKQNELISCSQVSMASANSQKAAISSVESLKKAEVPVMQQKATDVKASEVSKSDSGVSLLQEKAVAFTALKIPPMSNPP